MMRCSSIWPICRRLLFGPRTPEACPTRRNPLKTHAIHRNQSINAPAKSERVHPFTQPIHPWRSSTPTVIPTGSALSP
jgi:hypothetical protein